MIIKTYVAGGALTHRRMVKAGSVDGEVVLATAATDDVIGITDCPGGVAQGGRVDVVLHGVTEVEAGGSISRWAYVCADASGRAVAAAPAAGVNNGIAGRVTIAAASGDLVQIFINATRIQG